MTVLLTERVPMIWIRQHAMTVAHVAEGYTRSGATLSRVRAVAVRLLHVIVSTRMIETVPLPQVVVRFEIPLSSQPDPWFKTYHYPYPMSLV